MPLVRLIRIGNFFKLPQKQDPDYNFKGSQYKKETIKKLLQISPGSKIDSLVSSDKTTFVCVYPLNLNFYSLSFFPHLKS